MIQVLKHNLRQFLKSHVPNWYKEKTDAELNQYIDDMVNFAHECHVYKEANIRKLIVFRFNPGFDIPLSDFRYMKLCRKNFREDFRVDQFCTSLTQKEDLIRITLESDIKSQKDG